MASRIVNRGLQVIGGRASGTADGFAAIQSMSIDDSSNALAAGDTALNSSGAVANFVAADFSAIPTRSGQTVSQRASFASGLFNMNTIRRIVLHNAAAASVTASSATVVGGIDTQSLVKNASLTVVAILDIDYSGPVS